MMTTRATSSGTSTSVTSQRTTVSASSVENHHAEARDRQQQVAEALEVVTKVEKHHFKIQSTSKIKEVITSIGAMRVQ